MKEENMFFVDVTVDNLVYPLKVISKPNCNGVNTIADITVRAKIDAKYENEFAGQIIRLVNKRSEYKGPHQLSSKILDYINSIGGLSASVYFAYPYFIERTSAVAEEKFLIKYDCGLTLERVPLLKYNKRFKVKIPLNLYEGLWTLVNEHIELPSDIIVEIEGQETIFTEDIVEAVEEIIYSLIYGKSAAALKENGSSEPGNFNSRFIEKIRNSLLSKYKIDNCAVKISKSKLTYLYTAERSPKREEINIDSAGEEEHIFI